MSLQKTRELVKGDTGRLKISESFKKTTELIKDDVEITRDDVILTDELIKITLKHFRDKDEKDSTKEKMDEFLVEEFKKSK